MEDRQTCFDRLVGLVGGLVGAAHAIGGCGEATDILYVDCEHSKCNHTPYRVFMLIRGDRAAGLISTSMG